MRAGQQVTVQGEYLRTGPVEMVNNRMVKTAMVRVNGFREPLMVQLDDIKPVVRQNIRLSEVDYEIDRDHLAKTIRRLRQSKNISQRDFGSKLGVSQPTVCMWEKGLVVPPLSRLRSIATVLGVSVSDILEKKRGRPS